MPTTAVAVNPHNPSVRPLNSTEIAAVLWSIIEEGGADPERTEQAEQALTAARAGATYEGPSWAIAFHATVQGLRAWCAGPEIERGISWIAGALKRRAPAPLLLCPN